MRPCGLGHPSARVGRQRFQIPPGTLCVKHTEGQGRLTRSRDTRDGSDLIERDIHIDIFQVMYARPPHLHAAGKHLLVFMIHVKRKLLLALEFILVLYFDSVLQVRCLFFFPSFYIVRLPFPNYILPLLLSHGNFHFKCHCVNYFVNSISAKLVYKNCQAIYRKYPDIDSELCYNSSALKVLAT